MPMIRKGGRRQTNQQRRSHDSPIMQFSQLNNDVILEIFLQFVAIDWDGPFTLMLVCTKWSNLVISQPRVWTWIMVDETQTEWRERMEVAAHFSRNLPLQIVLKVPFVSQVLLSHITCRCTSLFLDSRHLEDRYFISRSRSWAKPIVSHEQFTKYSAEFKQSNDTLLTFLKGVPTHDIQIRSEDQHHASFAYSAWYIHERLNQRARIQEVIKSGETSIITALVFKHGESAPLPRIQVLVTDLWGVLPLLSNLCYLELAENYIRVPKGTVLSRIRLRSLQILKIDSPMMGSLFLSLEDDVWLGFLSLLDTITMPNLEDLSLHGPLHRIIAAIIKNHGRFDLLQLHVSISVFDETVDQERLDSKLVWHGLRRCTVNIPEQNKARRHADSEVVDALRLLFKLIPTHCSVQLLGDAILEPIVQSDLLRDVELHIITQMVYSGVIHKPLSSPRKIRSLSLTGGEQKSPRRVPWILYVEELWVGLGPPVIYPSGPSLSVRVMECAPRTLFEPEVGFISAGIKRDLFSNLVDIRCDYDLAERMITDHETPQLRSLTLSSLDPSLPHLLSVVERASHRLLSLDTLGMSGIPEWHHLLLFVANFNRSQGRGISTVKFSGLPHPAILHHLGRAFRGQVEQPDILLELFEFQKSQINRRYPSGCYECALFGWSCYGIEYCTKLYSSDMVTITADMPLAKYEGDWGPDGQGWEDNLNAAHKREVDAKYEQSTQGQTLPSLYRHFFPSGTGYFIH